MSIITGVDEVSGKGFDYIIIGGGNTGLTLAVKLSEDASKSVLVLESGEANLNDQVLLWTVLHGSHYGQPQYDWDHKTSKQKHINDRIVTWQRGKGLGGSSSINFLSYTKPPAREVDEWEKLGNPGWNWAEYQRCAQRIERFVPPPPEVQKKWNADPAKWTFGTKGSVGIGYPTHVQDGEIAIKQTLLNAGIPEAPHPFDGDPNGLFYLPATIDSETQTRSYATTAFYLPNKDRKNLFVLAKAHVHRVLTEPDRAGNLTAVGVQFGHSGETHTVHANKEVIISAGALKSPQILELSGIGRRDVLEKIGVPVKVELPGVGENVQEHMSISFSWELKDDYQWDTLDVLRDPDTFAKHVELHKEGKGLFTSGMSIMAFAPLERVTPKAAEIHRRAREEIAQLDPSSVLPGYLEQMEMQLARIKPGEGSCTMEFCVVPACISFPNPPVAGKRYVSVLGMMNGPFSRGTIHAKSSNPDEDPEMDPHYLERRVDVEVFTEVAKYTLNLENISPMKDIISKRLNPAPSAETEEDLIDWAKQAFHSTCHTASSCSMLPREKGGVVDPQLKVYGTNNLRIADISIVPLHISSHTQSTAYFIAEKASEIIKAAQTA